MPGFDGWGNDEAFEFYAAGLPRGLWGAALEYQRQFKRGHPVPVPSDDVQPWRQRYAERLIGWAWQRMGEQFADLPPEPPPVKWFSTLQEKLGCLGRVLPSPDPSGTIWIAEEVGDYTLAKVLTHECVHAAKMVSGAADDEATTRREGLVLLDRWDAAEARRRAEPDNEPLAPGRTVRPPAPHRVVR